ncbi:ABC transporter ATP-binding protein [Jeotgalibacillus salarius]|uniref:ABC transporter ATP-binding protein n=1 Tax=Jeotgalibacillus salarius TaxID=546023 RepID=A0A4Y8LIV2_9BACL|nr:ABC transporter ATP-binding protein [Jeotgalibacillus salarius]TFE02398.1 ABC transporter ATP-binding protein [Jeotgalibacillus salarius]
MSAIVSMNDLSKSYQLGEEQQTVLKSIQLEVQQGDFVTILGPSGSGKSTLMNMIGCLDTPSSGDYTVGGKNTADMSEKELAALRNKEIGFVFQQFQLLPRLSILENVELPLIYSGLSKKVRRNLAADLLGKVGLADKLSHKPNQLSGGQQQRVAIARALVTAPSLLLADEPTGALDQQTGKQIMTLFTQLHQEGKTIVMITHDEKIARYGSRIIHLLDGEIREERGQGV